MKKRELIKFVVFVVDDNKAVYFGMRLEPCQHLVPTRSLWHVRNDIYERDAPMLGAEESRRVVAPSSDNTTLARVR